MTVSVNWGIITILPWNCYEILPMDARLKFIGPGLQAVCVPVEKFQYHSCRIIFIGKSICLIRIYMHGE